MTWGDLVMGPPDQGGSIHTRITANHHTGSSRTRTSPVVGSARIFSGGETPSHAVVNGALRSILMSMTRRAQLSLRGTWTNV